MNLPEKFTITDDGHYNHKGVSYECGPGYFKIINSDPLPKGEAKYLLDDDFVPTGKEVDGGIEPISEFRTGLNIGPDPRRTLHSGELIDLSEYGLEGKGYLVHREDEFFFSDKIVQFDSDTQFTSYVFMRKGPSGDWKEFKEQRWIYTIH